MTARRLLLLALLVAPAISCVDGAYAIVNPNDPLMRLEMRLRGGTDTIRVAGEVVLYQLVTTPVVTGYEVLWLSSNPLWLASTGNGSFVTGALPPSARTILVTAAFGTREAFASVVIMPPP